LKQVNSANIGIANLVSVGTSQSSSRSLMGAAADENTAAAIQVPHGNEPCGTF
jgi:hypothetical protein